MGFLWKTSGPVRQKLTACRERRCVCLKVRVAVASSCHYLHCSTSDTSAVTPITICTCGVCPGAASAAGWGSLMSASTIGGSVCTTMGSVVKPLPLPEPLSSSPDKHKIQYNTHNIINFTSMSAPVNAPVPFVTDVRWSYFPAGGSRQRGALLDTTYDKWNPQLRRQGRVGLLWGNKKRLECFRWRM